MLTAEATLRELLDQDQRAEAALEKAFNLNHRQDWLAVQLARRYARAGNDGKAINLLNVCLAKNPSSKTAHLEMAKLLMRKDPTAPIIVDHLKSSFSLGDDHFEGQFWYARELFVRGAIEVSKELFSSLDQRAPSKYRKLAGGELLNSDGSIRELSGQAIRKEEGYAFVRFNGISEDVFASRADSADGEWNKLAAFKAVEGRLAFTRRGPRAVRIRSVE
jgi:hypothetical protein